jgi:hypothetical protein
MVANHGNGSALRSYGGMQPAALSPPMMSPDIVLKLGVGTTHQKPSSGATSPRGSAQF